MSFFCRFGKPSHVKRCGKFLLLTRILHTGIHVSSKCMGFQRNLLVGIYSGDLYTHVSSKSMRLQRNFLVAIFKGSICGAWPIKGVKKGLKH